MSTKITEMRAAYEHEWNHGSMKTSFRMLDACRAKIAKWIASGKITEAEAQAAWDAGK